MFAETPFLIKYILSSTFNFMIISISVQTFLFSLNYVSGLLRIKFLTFFESFLKTLSILTLVISFLLFIQLSYTYVDSAYSQSLGYLINRPTVKSEVYEFKMLIAKKYLSLNIDVFSLVIVLLSYLVGFLSLLASDIRIFWKNSKYLYYFNLFTFVVFFLAFSGNFVVFFIAYECLLLPSFLLVYYVSPSKRSLQAALYFLLWTQLGSFIVLFAIIYITSTHNIYEYSQISSLKLSYSEAYFLYTVLFIGFGIKVPIWPTHYWLTKTHVEASAGFSMYLSGFLVKTAVFGFYKLTTAINIELYTFMFIGVCCFGVLDSSLKMWAQTDLKKLVAYGTVQEMNLIFAAFLLGDSECVLSGMLFCLTHGLLSVMMFFIVDCVQRRYNSRYLVELSGVLHVTPNLGVCIFFMCVFFSGVPGTLKFTSEFMLFSSILESSSFFFMLIMLTANVFGLIGFLKCWFNVLFGFNTTCYNNPILDLSLKELGILISCFLCLILFNFTVFIF